MKEYMTSLGTVLMLIAISNMLIPEGSIKKYTSLAMGFMLISTALSFLPSVHDFSFKGTTFEISDAQIATAEAQYRGEVIKRHRENIEKEIEKKLRHEGKAYAEVSPEGEVVSVTLAINGDESRAVEYIVSELGVERERITIKYDKN